MDGVFGTDTGSRIRHYTSQEVYEIDFAALSVELHTECQSWLSHYVQAAKPD
jgi:hypothetical protein